MFAAMIYGPISAPCSQNTWWMTRESARMRRNLKSQLMSIGSHFMYLDPYIIFRNSLAVVCSVVVILSVHDDVIKWEHFPRYWPFVRGIHWWAVNPRSFFNLCLNKRLSKQSWGWWLQTPSRSLWRHCNGLGISKTINKSHRYLATHTQ